MVKLKRLLFILLIVTMFPFTHKAQEGSPRAHALFSNCIPNPSPPEASSMVRYGNETANLYSGTFSMAIPIYTYQDGANRYLYGGKELQERFGIDWYDSSARFQTMNGIFTGIDPFAEKYYSISPYAYCAGNPHRYEFLTVEAASFLNL